MASNIELAASYLPLLDEVYAASSKSAILDATKVDILNGNTIKVYKTTMDGLADYSRNGGFTEGEVSGAWETMTLSKDRGRSFQVDRMDNEETLDMAFGSLASEFIRTKVAPEVDAYTFAKLAGTSGILTATADDIAIGTTDVPNLINVAEAAMNEAEVPETDRILFISENAYAGLREKIVRTVSNEATGINHAIEYYDDMRVVRVPQGRFYTAITLHDGATINQLAGGYARAESGYKINFMIVHPSALTKVVKHAMPRIFTPDENQKADAWKFDYRVYHDTFVYQNKVKGIYLHRGKTTA